MIDNHESGAARIHIDAASHEQGTTFIVGSGVINSSNEPPFAVPLPSPATVHEISVYPPHSATALAGRDTVIEELLAFLSTHEATRPGDEELPPNMAIVTGMAGVGKSALLRHVAEVAVRRGWFEGGAYLVELSGTASPPDSQAALCIPLLQAIDATTHGPGPVPHNASFVLRRTLEKSAREGKRVLILLDNVTGAGQIVDALRGHRSHRILIASQRRLADLDGARMIPLKEIHDAAAVQMLDTTLRRLDPRDTRIQEDDASAKQLASICGRLPLALRIAAAVLADIPSRPVASLVEELTDARDRIGGFEYGELVLRAALDLSFKNLDDEERRLLGMISLHPSGSISLEAAAALVGQPPPRTLRLLGRIARSNLVEPDPALRRWHIHDLVRLYAREAIDADASARRAAIDRLLTFCVNAALQADAVLNSGLENGSFATADGALAWIMSERALLVGAIELAEEARRAADSSTLLICLWQCLDWQRHQVDLETAAITGLFGSSASVRRSGSVRRIEELGWAQGMAGSLEESVTSHKTAALLYSRDGDVRGEARSLRGLGTVLIAMERYDSAAQVFSQAASTFRKLGEASDAAFAYSNLGVCFIEMDQLDSAAESFEYAVRLSTTAEDIRAKGRALVELGCVYRRLGRLDDALAALTAAISVAPRAQEAFGYATALMNRGNTYADLEMTDDAIADLRRAVRCYQRLGDLAEAAKAMANLARLQQLADRAQDAIETLEQAITLFDDINDRHSAARTQMNLGLALRTANRPEAALDAFGKARAVFQDTDDKGREAKALVGIARLLRAAGQDVEALDHMATAASRYTAIGQAEAARRVEDLARTWTTSTS